MMDKILRWLHGGSTRGAQVLNFYLSGLWLVAFILDVWGVSPLQLPATLIDQKSSIIVCLIITLVVVAGGFLAHGRQHQVMKTFGLLIGATTQLILANGFVSTYPPFEMITSICVSVSMWYTTAVFYVVHCEGLNG